MVDIQWNGKRPMLSLFIRKVINKLSNTISLLPICGKIFERLLYNTKFDIVAKNNLFYSNQSGFRPRYSCISQLLLINHGILNVFDKGLEVHGIFLDISKGFDKVYNDGLIFNPLFIFHWPRRKERLVRFTVPWE